ncbi:MAG TPA: hypothetical protein VGZ71_15750, partial [Puia sp.]|nr:hypothetical protein [Puia sp.]
MKSYINRLLPISAFLLLFLSGAIAQAPVDSLETSKMESTSAAELASLRQKIFDNNNIAHFDIPISATTTIISPDPIVLVDISSDKAQGELSPSTDNRIFRIKPTAALLENDFVVVTVVTKKYVSVMKLTAKNSQAIQAVYTIAINPKDTYRL